MQDLNILLQEMKTLRNEYYSTGNVDFAGRYVFTGYRTNTTLTRQRRMRQRAIPTI
ncbi:MAG: hypothetical protein V8S42_06700 [Lachnospiraceae bacterium]